MTFEVRFNLLGIMTIDMPDGATAVDALDRFREIAKSDPARLAASVRSWADDPFDIEVTGDDETDRADDEARAARDAHEAGRCDMNCRECEAEIARDEAPGGQCYEGTCSHDDCMRERAEADARHEAAEEADELAEGEAAEAMPCAACGLVGSEREHDDPMICADANACNYRFDITNRHNNTPIDGYEWTTR